MKLPIESEMAFATLAGFIAAHQSTASDEVGKAIATLRSVIARQIDALEEAKEYFDNQSDVVDGDYGIPEANKEMRLATAMREAVQPSI